jgi:hypothetical protein
MLRRFLRRKNVDILERHRATPLSRDRRKSCHLQEALLATRSIDGAIVECGVATAGSLSLITHASRRSRDDRSIIAVDSYEGFPKLSEHDADWFDPDTMKLHYKRFDVPFVKENLTRSGLTDDEVASITFVKGWIPDVLSGVEGPISMLHLDVDLYNPYADSLRILWPQVRAGGWVLFDEYDQGRDTEKWPGAKRAIDEFLERESLTIERHWSGFTHVVKPG